MSRPNTEIPAPLVSIVEQLSKSKQQSLIDYAMFLLAQQDEEKVEVRPFRFGCLKGTFQMSSDFDAPLDDFKDYME